MLVHVNKLLTKMPSSYQTIASLIPRTATDQDPRMSFLLVNRSKGLGASKPSKFHELRAS